MAQAVALDLGCALGGVWGQDADADLVVLVGACQEPDAGRERTGQGRAPGW